MPHRMLGFLMFLSVLLDLYSAQCPLTLDPPVLVQQLGESSNVTCSSTDEGLESIYWIYNNIQQLEEINGSAVLSIPLLNWDTQAWCEMRFNNTYNCSEDLQITVYNIPDKVLVSSGENDTMVEGREHLLKCGIFNVAPVGKLQVKWYRDNLLLYVEMFKGSDVTPQNVSLYLTVTPKREHNGANFTCEAELLLEQNPLPPKTSAPYTAVVHYAPEFQDKDDKNISLNSISDVSLLCEAMGYPFPQTYWIKDGETVAKDTYYLNISQVNVSSTYNCIASNYLGNISKKFDVIVMEPVTTSAPERQTTPKAQGSDDCQLKITPDKLEIQYGGSASANCSTLVTDAVGIGWEAATGGIGLSNVPWLMWRVESLKNWTVTADCFLTHKRFQCEKGLHITVYNVPDKVLVSSAENDTMVEGREHQLKCDIVNVAPVGKLQVKWYQDNHLLHMEMFKGSVVTPQNVSLYLTVTPKREHNGANFTCEAELLLEQNPVPSRTSAPYTAVVHYAPEFKAGNSTKEFIKGENVTLDCIAEGLPFPEVQWYYPSAANVKNNTRGRQHFVNIIGATSTNEGVYSCGATNKFGRVTRTVTLILKGETTWLWLIFTIILIVAFVIVMFYLIRKKKHGHYNVVSDNIPLSTARHSVV